jgi:hypothetical protein
MFFVQSDADRVLRIIEKALDDMVKSLSTREQEYHAIMSGGVKETFLQGSAGRPVTEITGVTHTWPELGKYAKRERQMAGINAERPMLSGTNDPAGSKFYAAYSTSSYTVNGPIATVRPSDGMLARFIREHQEGDSESLKVFKRIGLPKQGDWRGVPARPFVFWTRKMADGAIGVLKNEFEASIQRNK